MSGFLGNKRSEGLLAPSSSDCPDPPKGAVAWNGRGSAAASPRTVGGPRPVFLPFPSFWARLLFWEEGVCGPRELIPGTIVRVLRSHPGANSGFM